MKATGANRSESERLKHQRLVHPHHPEARFIFEVRCFTLAGGGAITNGRFDLAMGVPANSMPVLILINAGGHSDIGGSYSENESRLSDIALEWMVHAAENLPDGNTPNANGIKVDRRFLKLYPDPCGPQHDATEPGYFGGRVKWWTKTLREIDPNAILHPSVYERFAAKKVQHFYAMQPYRPENLSKHEKLKQYYTQER